MMQEPTLGRKIAAWGVHLFTASGLVAGFMAILAINKQDWREAMAWLILCLIIDGVDGTFARLVKVWEVLPNMNGKTIDYVIDFATYAIIPIYFFYQADLVTGAWRFICAVVMLLVSALYYGKEGMVSEDKYFIGFPVLWNMVVFYMVFVCRFPEWGNVVWILIFAVLHFVPVKFAYPSQQTRLQKLSIFVTMLFILSLIGLVYLYPQRPLWLVGAAILTAAYYATIAVWDTWFQAKS